MPSGLQDRRDWQTAARGRGATGFAWIDMRSRAGIGYPQSFVQIPRRFRRSLVSARIGR
jgi:hypothetical protein